MTDDDRTAALGHFWALGEEHLARQIEQEAPPVQPSFLDEGES